MVTATTSNIPTSASVKAYIDAVATGLSVQSACVTASTTNLTVVYNNGAAGVGATLTNAGALAAIMLDDVSPTVGQRVLIKNQTASSENGIYTVTVVGTGATAWVLTRATDFDTPTEIAPGDFVALSGGTTQGGSSWLQIATVAVIGTDPITFIQFTSAIPVTVISGGTGNTSFTAYAPITGGTTPTGNLQSIALGASGTVIQSNGVGALPSFTTATYPTTTNVSRLLYSSADNVVSQIVTANSAVLATSVTGVPAWSASMTNGSLLIGSVGATPVIANLTAGSGISIANAAGAITITASPAGNWTNVVSLTQLMVGGQNYVANNAALVAFTLPVLSNFGDEIRVVGKGLGAWNISTNAGQNIRHGNVNTAISVDAQNQFDSISLICTVANTTWTAYASIGQLLFN